MSDYVYVNIYGSGIIPWIGVRAPIFGLHIGLGIYQILSRDGRINMELTTPAEAKIKEQEYYKKLEATTVSTAPTEKIEIPDKIIITKKEESKIVETKKEDLPIAKEKKSIESELNDDAEIDNAINSASDSQTHIGRTIMLDDEKNADSQFKFYNDAELLIMTKAQLKKILESRGYVKGPYAPKYHDKVEDLIAKVKRTQTFK